MSNCIFVCFLIRSSKFLAAPYISCPYFFLICSNILIRSCSRDAAVFGRKKYSEKCLNFLHTNSFIQLDHDPRKTIAGKN